MIKQFEQVFLEALNIYGSNPFDKLDGKTLIFFDTETTGLSPHDKQITEVAAIAVSGDTFEELGTFNEFVKLSNETLSQMKQQEGLPPDPKNKTVRELLTMSDYQEGKANKEEAATLSDFMDFISKYPNPTLVAHNAAFDMKMIMTKLKVGGSFTVPRYKVMDTMMFSRFFLLPAVQTLASKGDEMGIKLLNLLKKPDSVSKNGLHKLSSSLGSLNKLVKDKLSNIKWHSGLSDVQVTVELFKFMKNYYEQHSGEMHEPLFKMAYAKAKRSAF